jgi:hypothetical protein
MIYVPSFINIGSSVQNLFGRGNIHRETESKVTSLSPLLFIHNKENTLISNKYFENVEVQVRLENDSNRSELYTLASD